VSEGLSVLKGNNVLPDALIERHGQGAFWAARALLADGTPEAITGRCPIHMYVFFLPRCSIFQYLALRTDKDIAFGIEAGANIYLPTPQCEIIPATDCRIDPGR
jgi:hypothetical protein